MKGKYLLHIPRDCGVGYQTYRFDNRQYVHPGHPLVLPKVKGDPSQMVIARRKPIHLDILLGVFSI